MADTPYCPLLSINKEFPVMCQEELCMWYVKQLKLCSLTVMAYTNALTLQSPPGSPGQVQKPQASQPLKQPLTQEAKKESQQKPINPFALDDLD